MARYVGHDAERHYAGRQKPGGRPGAAPGQDVFTYSGDYYLYINGGTIVVNAAGDGVDVNGAIEMTDGLVIVHGPTEQMNGSLDYDGYFNISGGYLVAAGSAGMAHGAQPILQPVLSLDLLQLDTAGRHAGARPEQRRRRNPDLCTGKGYPIHRLLLARSGEW